MYFLSCVEIKTIIIIIIVIIIIVIIIITGVSSKNVSPDPYYCHSRALAVTLGVKCTCSPAVHRCTPTAFQERINAFCHRCQPVA